MKTERVLKKRFNQVFQHRLSVLCLFIILLPLVTSLPTVPASAIPTDVPSQSSDSQAKPVLTDVMQKGTAKSSQVGTFTNPYIKLNQPVTLQSVGEKIGVYVDSSFYRLNNTMFVIEFYRGSTGYNVIKNRYGNVQVYDERMVLEYQQGSNWKQRGVAKDVFLTKITDYWYEVTRRYDDSLGTTFNVTYVVKGDEPVKTTISIKSGQTDNYRLSWQLSGIADTVNTASKLAYTEYASKNFVTFGKNESRYNWISFNWNDVSKSFGSITERSYSDVAQGRKATITFNIGVINAGETKKIDPSTVGTSTTSSATQGAYQRKGFYSSSTGRWWNFYIDGADFGFRTSVDGVTFGAWTVARAGGSGAGDSYSIYFDGTYVHYAYADFDSFVFYRRALLNVDGTITWSAAEQTAVSVALHEMSFPNIAVDTSGYPWVGYRDFTGADSDPWVTKSSANDGTWTTAESFPYQLRATGSAGIATVVSLNSQRMCVAYHTGGYIRARLWTGSWEAEVDLGIVPLDRKSVSVTAIGDDVYVAVLQATSNDIHLKKRTYGVGWGSWEDVQSATTSTSYPVLSTNTVTGEVFCFWAGSPTANHVYFKVRSSAGVWDSSPTDWINEATDTLTGNDRLTCFYQAYSGKIGLMYMTLAASPYYVRFAFIQMESTSSSSLSWGGMTKAHWDGTYYWQFWSNGTDFVGKSSNDGVDWTRNPIKILSGWTRVVAVACSGTVVHLAYGDKASRTSSGSLTVHMHYRKGTFVDATTIALDSERTAFTWTQAATLDAEEPTDLFMLDMRYWDITVGTDGLITIIFSRHGYYDDYYSYNNHYYVSRYAYNVVKSTNGDGSEWGSSTLIESANSYWPDDSSTIVQNYGVLTYYSDYRVRPLLAPLASGVVVCFDNKNGVGRYSLSTAWTTHTNFDATIKDVNAWGSVAGGNGGGKVGLVFLDSDDDLEVVWYDGTTLTADHDVQVGTFTSPSITSNNATNGAWYLLFINSTSVQYLKCTLYDGTWDTTPTDLATGLTSPVDLSSARTVLNNAVIYCYQTGPVVTNYTVNFATLTFNTAPTNDALTLDLTGASYKGTKTLLAGKQDYKFILTCTDAQGVTDITYAEIRLDYATKNVILRATRGTGDAWTFAEQSDSSNYVTLNTGGSSHSTSGNQKTFNFLVTINWAWDDATETLGIRAYVIDAATASDTDDYANIFGVENDLTFSSLDIYKDKGGYTKLLLSMNGLDGSTSFPDSATGKTVTANGNAQIDTAQSKFGGASGLFNGSGDYLSLADSADWAFGSGGFTFDFWVRFPSSPGSAQCVFAQYVDDSNTQMVLRTSTSWVYQIKSAGSFIIEISGSSTINANTWYHIAVTRSGNTFYVFQDGTQIGTGTDADAVPDFAGSAYVGTLGSGTYPYWLNGWLDEFRVSKGIARWTSNFTPPTAAYSANQRYNPSTANLLASGAVTYEGTSIYPPDGNYNVLVKLSGVQKGTADTTLVSGAFSISDVTAEATVASYSYTVEATYMSAAGSFTAVVVDRLQVQSYTVSDSRADINVNVNIDALIWFDYDNSVCTTATITINGYSATHQGSGVYRITRTSTTVTGVTYNTVACSAESTYGITTVDQNSQSSTVIWDRVKLLTLGRVSSPIALNANGTIYCTAELEYDSHTLGAGDTITIEGVLCSWNYANSRFQGSETKSSRQTVTYDTFTSASEATYGITVGTMNSLSTSIMWASAPTNDALSLKNGDTVSSNTYHLLARYRIYYISYNVSHADGLTYLTYAEIRLDPTGSNIIFRYTRATGTFTEQSDASNYVELVTASCTATDSGTQVRLLIYFYVNWNYPNEDLHNVQGYSYDTDTAFSDSDTYSNTYKVLKSLRVTTITVSPSTQEAGKTVTVSSTIVYNQTQSETTPFTPSDSEITGIEVRNPDGVKVGTAATTSSGAFTISDVTYGTGGVTMTYRIWIDGSHATFTDAYDVSSTTFTVEWTGSPPGTTSIGGGDTKKITPLTVQMSVPPRMSLLPSTTKEISVNFTWSGASFIRLKEVLFGNYTTWFTVDDLPKDYSSTMGVNAGTIKFKVTIPQGQREGIYDIPFTLVLKDVNTNTESNAVDFLKLEIPIPTVTGPFEPFTSFNLLLFGGAFLILLIVARKRTT